jgi:hypothetical protein
MYGTPAVREIRKDDYFAYPKTGSVDDRRQRITAADTQASGSRDGNMPARPSAVSRESLA